MNALILLSILLSAALGIARGADLAFGTDAVTGLCTVGSVWWRYAALGAVVLAAVLIGRHCAGKAETVRSRQPLAGVLAFAGAVCFLAAAGAQLAVGLSATSSFVRSILECICAVWLSTLGRCWLTPSGWKKPTGGLYLAVAGTVLLERADALYGEQFQLAPGGPHRSGVAGAGSTVAAEQPCPGAVPAKAGKRPHPVRRRSGSTLPVPVLGAALCSGSGGWSSGRTGPAAGAVCRAGTVLRGSAGRRVRRSLRTASGVTKTPSVLLV